jgi:hypothetical protein
MGKITRRQFSAKVGQGLAAGTLAGWLGARTALAHGKGRVVIIGGGAALMASSAGTGEGVALTLWQLIHSPERYSP